MTRDLGSRLAGPVLAAGLVAWVLTGHQVGPLLDPGEYGPLFDPIVWALGVLWMSIAAGVWALRRGAPLAFAVGVAWAAWFAWAAWLLGGRIALSLVAGGVLNVFLEVLAWWAGTRHRASPGSSGAWGPGLAGAVLVAPFVVLGPPALRWATQLGDRDLLEVWATSRTLEYPFGENAIALLATAAIASLPAFYLWGRGAPTVSDPG